jgi:MFS family permease
MAGVEQATRKAQVKKRWNFLDENAVWRNRTLLSVSFTILVAYIGTGMVGPVRVLYATEHGASLTVVDAMAGAFMLASFLFQFPAGWMADRWGHKRMMMISLLIQSVLSACYLIILDPVIYIGLRFLEGICAAALLPAARALVIGSAPSEQRGRAFGLFSAFFNVGFLLGPGVGGLLGYDGAFIGSVVMRLAAVIVTLLFIRSQTTQQRGIQNISGELSGWRSLRQLFTLPLVGAYIIAFGDYLYLGFDQTVMPIWLSNNIGASLAMIGLLYMFWSVPNIILSPLGGRIADRFPRRWLILLCGLGQIPLYIAYGLANSILPIIILFVVHGIFYAFIVPAIDSHVASASPDTQRGRVQGMYAAIGFLGALVGSNGLTPLYHLNFRFPLFAMGAGFGLCILVGSSLIFIGYRRGQNQTNLENEERLYER